MKENPFYEETQIPEEAETEAKALPNDVFEFKNGMLSILEKRTLTWERRKRITVGIQNEDLRSIVERLFERAYNATESHLIYKAVEQIKVKDAGAVASDHWRQVFQELCEREYDLPKMKAEGEEGDSKQGMPAERRRLKQEECLPAFAWTDWATRESAKRNKEIVPPRRLRVYFSLGDNERVVVGGPNSDALSKRGIRKPMRTSRLKTIGSRAVFNPQSGVLTVLLNPWKRHVERNQQPVPEGIKIFKGDCIWLEFGKKKRTGPGWYRVTEMSPRKLRLTGEVAEAKLKLVPAWLDLNQLVRVLEAKEQGSGTDGKTKKDQWEVDLNATSLVALYNQGKLSFRKKAVVPQEILRAEGNK